jgi:hypothetical protein
MAEGVTEEYWEEDIYQQKVYDWLFCADCDEDFACNSK